MTTIPTDAQHETPAGALDGLLVVEHAEMVAGPFCGKLLGLLGADVIKIEPPRVGDAARRRGPFYGHEPHSEGSGLFLYLNTNKRGITLDVSKAEGQRIFRELAQRADAVVSDAAPGALKALGIGYEDTLAHINPGLVMTRVTPFGLTGPYAHYKAHELNIYHAGGEGYVLPNGLALEMFPDRPPIKGPGYLASYHAGVTAAVGTLAGILARDSQGVGQLVDVSMQEAQISLNHMVVQRFINEVLETRITRSFRYAGVLPCSDGYVELLPLEQHQWENVVQLMGDPQWAHDERFHDPISRAKYGEEVDAHLRAWSRQHTMDELYREGQKLGIPIGPYSTAKDIVESEHERARGFFAQVAHPHTGPVTYPAWPFRMSETQPVITRAAPLLGQHNVEVLGWLGYSREDVADLARAGVI